MRVNETSHSNKFIIQILLLGIAISIQLPVRAGQVAGGATPDKSYSKFPMSDDSSDIQTPEDVLRHTAQSKGYVYVPSAPEVEGDKGNSPTNSGPAIAGTPSDCTTCSDPNTCPPPDDGMTGGPGCAGCAGGDGFCPVGIPIGSCKSGNPTCREDPKYICTAGGRWSIAFDFCCCDAPPPPSCSGCSGPNACPPPNGGKTGGAGCPGSTGSENGFCLQNIPVGSCKTGTPSCNEDPKFICTAGGSWSIKFDFCCLGDNPSPTTTPSVPACLKDGVSCNRPGDPSCSQCCNGFRASGMWAECGPTTSSPAPAK